MRIWLGLVVIVAATVTACDSNRQDDPTTGTNPPAEEPGDGSGSPDPPFDLPNLPECDDAIIVDAVQPALAGTSLTLELVTEHGSTVCTWQNEDGALLEISIVPDPTETPPSEEIVATAMQVFEDDRLDELTLVGGRMDTPLSGAGFEGAITLFGTHYDVGVHSLRMAGMTEDVALEITIEIARALGA